MKTRLDHLQVNVDARNMQFYQDLMTFLGWTKHEFEMPGTYCGYVGKHGESIWFMGQVKEVTNDYDGPGVNHIGIGAEKQGEVDDAINYLLGKGVEPLFETPRHRPIPSDDSRTYYQVMFTSPDNILFEVMYSGPRSG